MRLADYGFEYVKMEVRRSGQTAGCEYNAPEQMEHGPAFGTADAVDVYSISVITNQSASRLLLPVTLLLLLSLLVCCSMRLHKTHLQIAHPLWET